MSHPVEEVDEYAESTSFAPGCLWALPVGIAAWAMVALVWWWLAP